MPKVNVYLPDDLADAVRASGVPLSAVCQRALERAVRDVGAAKARRDVLPKLERFTNRARTVVRLAGEYAKQAGQEVGSEHVLLALIAEGDGVAAVALAGLGVTAERALEATETRPSIGDGNDVYGEALREALKLGHNYIGTEHIILALVRSSGPGREALDALGVTASSVQRAVVHILTGKGFPNWDKAAPLDVAAKLDEILRRLEELERRLPA